MEPHPDRKEGQGNLGWRGRGERLVVKCVSKCYILREFTLNACVKFIYFTTHKNDTLKFMLSKCCGC